MKKEREMTCGGGWHWRGLERPGGVEWTRSVHTSLWAPSKEGERGRGRKESSVKELGSMPTMVGGGVATGAPDQERTVLGERGTRDEGKLGPCGVLGHREGRARSARLARWRPGHCGSGVERRSRRWEMADRWGRGVSEGEGGLRPSARERKGQRARWASAPVGPAWLDGPMAGEVGQMPEKGGLERSKKLFLFLL